MEMLIAVIIIVLAIAVTLALMGPTFGVLGVGNFRGQKRSVEEPPKNE